MTAAVRARVSTSLAAPEATATHAEPLDTDIAIETPEHIVFRYRVAGPARRFFAYLLDVLLCYGVVIFIALVIGLSTVGLSGISDQMSGAAAAGVGFVMFLMFCAEWVYFVAFEGAWGTTPGKRLLGLRVVTTTGRPIGWSEAALRNVLRAADMLPIGYLVGVTSMACTRRFQRLGDLLADTMVILTQRASARTLGIALYPPASPEELATYPAVVRLDADERAAIELFLRRRMTLGPARAFELASMLVEPFSARYDFRNKDAVRALAVLYDLAMNAGREDAPPSSRHSSPPFAPSKEARRWP